jgi:glycosyltransferase involved in cell wall biosynthesis
MVPLISLVVPAYNEERNIPAFIAAVVPVLESIVAGTSDTFEIIFIDDGSKDGTLGMLAAASSQDPRIKVVGLARNFGKDVALSAGLAHATGKATIPIDCDLQHPPELIPQFVAKWREGYDMVIGVRSKRDEEGFVRRTLSRTYYKVMRAITSVEIPPNAGDFRLLDRKIMDVITKMPERHRFMKGIFAWPGFKVASIEFQANARANDTRSTWNFFKLWRFALDGLFSFSTAPLKWWTYVGLVSAGGAFIYLMITLIQKLFFGIGAPGYASLLIVLLFFNGLLMISNGIQGEYIARIFEEVKGRPLYVVGQTFGFADSTKVAAAPIVTAPVVATPLAAAAPATAPPFAAGPIAAAPIAKITPASAGTAGAAPIAKITPTSAATPAGGVPAPTPAVAPVAPVATPAQPSSAAASAPSTPAAAGTPASPPAGESRRELPKPTKPPPLPRVQ